MLVFAICTRINMKWNLPLYVPILIGTIAVALLYYFHFQQTKVRTVARYRVRIIKKTLGYNSEHFSLF